MFSHKWDTVHHLQVLSFMNYFCYTVFCFWKLCTCIFMFYLSFTKHSINSHLRYSNIAHTRAPLVSVKPINVEWFGATPFNTHKFCQFKGSNSRKKWLRSKFRSTRDLHLYICNYFSCHKYSYVLASISHCYNMVCRVLTPVNPCTNCSSNFWQNTRPALKKEPDEGNFKPFN